MKTNNFFYLLLLSFVLIFSCNNREDLPKQLSDNIHIDLDEKSNVIKFRSKEDLKSFMDNYDDHSDKIFDLYEKGFVPYKVTDGTNEEMFIELTQKKNNILNKSNIFAKKSRNSDFSESEDEENLLISNDNFASLLSAEGHIEIADKVYFYTEKGLFFADKEDEEYLRNYIANNNKMALVGENIIDEKITSYVPNKDLLLDPDVTIVAPNMADSHISLLPEDSDGGYTSGGGSRDLTIPTNTSSYLNCVPRKPFIDNIFGRYYVCEYYFNNKKKLRSSFAAEDYYIWFDVYAQAKFKQKTWLGWYSDRSADKVYVKVKNAMITMKDRKIKLKLKAGDIQKVVNDIDKLLNTTSNKRMAYLSNVYTTTNGTTTNVENYTLSKNEIINGANGNDIITPTRKQLVSNVNVNFSELFGKSPEKVLVFTILGKQQSLTNQQILDYTYKAYKKYIVDPNNKAAPSSIGVVIMQKAVDGTSPEDAQIVSYAFGNDVVQVTRLAVAQKKFHIPKQFKLEKALLSVDFDNWKNTKIDIEVSWKVPDKYDVEIEGGAHYGGKWGGSKFKVVKN